MSQEVALKDDQKYEDRNGVVKLYYSVCKTEKPI
jgi:hypothetical protein